MQAVCKTHCIKDNLNVGQEETWQVSRSKHRMILFLIAHSKCNSFVASLLGRGIFTTLLNSYYNSFSNTWLSLTLYLHYDCSVLPVWCFSLISVGIGVACFSLHCAMPNKLQQATCCLLSWSRLQLLLIPGNCELAFLISSFPVDEQSCKAQRAVLCLSCFDTSPRNKSHTR